MAGPAGGPRSYNTQRATLKGPGPSISDWGAIRVPSGREYRAVGCKRMIVRVCACVCVLAVDQ